MCQHHRVSSRTVHISSNAFFNVRQDIVDQSIGRVVGGIVDAGRIVGARLDQTEEGGEDGGERVAQYEFVGIVGQLGQIGGDACGDIGYGEVEHPSDTLYVCM